MKGILKTKTFWAALAGIFGTIGGLVAGEMSVYVAVMAIVGFVLTIFIRDAVAKVEPK
jgi:hypothetical protein